MAPRIILAIAGLMGFLSVALGAFGAHALKSKLSVDMLAILNQAFATKCITPWLYWQ